MIRIPRLAHIGVFLLLFCAAFPFFGWPAGLWVLFAIPVAVAVWIERTRTTVSESGIDARSMFSTRHIDWSEVKGLRLPKRGYLQLHLADDSDVRLPAVSYDRLADLVAASGGRIPDPFFEPEDADAAAEADETAVAESTVPENEVASAESAKAEDTDR
ncbi:MAG: Low molecular weight protein antigen [Nocardia sp.]|uniref:PH domain-containing protein n=1 Tax=Nocardia sp. TaxID=1821 RepID=UPI002627A3AF|nr:PH domain-containing protein [Nocardia sp.]MCU1641098.1 Low molecular weight protein antigen [Nocardia sp.]